MLVLVLVLMMSLPLSLLQTAQSIHCPLLLLLDKRLIFQSDAVLFCSAVFTVSSQTAGQPDIRPNLLY